MDELITSLSCPVRAGSKQYVDGLNELIIEHNSAWSTEKKQFK